MKAHRRAPLALAALLLAAGPGHAAEGRKPVAPAEGGWLGDEMPLPLAVRSPEDLALKSAAEKVYLMFNLLAGGKLAWDRARFDEAATKWESLLTMSGLDPEVERVVRPLAREARRRAAGQAPSPPDLPAPLPEPAPTATESEPPATSQRALAASVRGTVRGGGAQGPGGAVVWLRRKDGPTPRPAPLKSRVLSQRDKTFDPHVLPVTVGTKVGFHNEDTIFHNVFSLSKPNNFDSGLFKDGATYYKTFDAPGAVQVLCNIHAQMLAYVVVVDSPWFAQVGRSGKFSINGLPPGTYEAIAWHESSSDVTRQTFEVAPAGVATLNLSVGGDKSRMKFVPDKYGKPRQVQLGY